MSGVKGRSGKKPLNLPVQDMISMYLKSGTLHDVAAAFHVSARTAGRRLSAAGLDLVGIARERRRGNRHG